jgi:hypothetical protein
LKLIKNKKISTRLYLQIRIFLPEHPDPDEKASASEEDRTEIPEVSARLTKLDQLFEDRADDNQDVVHTNHDVPE